MEEWKRPENVKYPQVWGEFEGKALVNGAKRKYWIQDVPEEMFEDIIHHMITGFLLDEPLCKHINIVDDAQSVAETEILYRKYLLPQKLALVCLTKDEKGQNVIVGMNCLGISTPDEKDYQANGVKWNIIYGVVDYVTKYNSFFQKYKLPCYLTALGLFVRPEFRGEGIGLELLKAREPLCKAVGIPATCTVFTSIASQKLAQRAGFQEMTEINYEDIQKIDPTWKFPGIEKHTKSCKYMFIIY